MGIADERPLLGSYQGEQQALRICVYQDRGVPKESVHEMTGAIMQRFAPLGIRVEIPWIRPWQRNAFAVHEIVNQVATLPLECPCDRILAIVDRDFGDFLWGILLPEYFGAVEDVTLTKGYAVGRWGSLNQVLSKKSPTDVAVHEAFHFLGCGHELGAESCRLKIAGLLEAAKENREKGQDFFPAMSLDGRIHRTRAEVDRLLGAALQSDLAAAGIKNPPDPSCG
ncbi:MAG: hypothetical protein AB1512_23060 [Thermodesulfobacteriota bacterium]